MKILTREEFKETLEEIRSVNDYSEGLNTFLYKHGADGYVFQPDCIDTTIKLLEKIFDDEENHWISYYIWELNFGKDYEKGMVVCDDIDIPLETIDDLYNLLLENIKFAKRE